MLPAKHEVGGHLSAQAPTSCQASLCHSSRRCSSCHHSYVISCYLQTSYCVPSGLHAASTASHYSSFPCLFFYYYYLAITPVAFTFLFSFFHTVHMHVSRLSYRLIESLRYIIARFSILTEKRSARQSGAWFSLHANRAALDCVRLSDIFLF